MSAANFPFQRVACVRSAAESLNPCQIVFFCQLHDFRVFAFGRYYWRNTIQFDTILSDNWASNYRTNIRHFNRKLEEINSTANADKDFIYFLNRLILFELFYRNYTLVFIAFFLKIEVILVVFKLLFKNHWGQNHAFLLWIFFLFLFLTPHVKLLTILLTTDN